jgi:LytR cell envelope-related transcriptional attenuator
VFGVLIAFLTVAGVGALAVYTGALDAPFSRPFSSPEPEGAELEAPCLPAVEGQPDGALPVPYSSVQVRVLNASQTTGLAAAHAQVLGARGFAVVGTGNFDTTLERNELRFGVAGITAAYTLAAHYPEMRLVLDARTDATLDLLAGIESDRPLPEDQVQLAADRPMENVAGCVPAAEITPAPVWTPPPSPSPAG